MILQNVKARFTELVKNTDLFNEEIIITCKALDKEEAIGNPLHNDYPVQNGKIAFFKEIEDLVIRSVQTIPINNSLAGAHLHIGSITALNDSGRTCHYFCCRRRGHCNRKRYI